MEPAAQPVGRLDFDDEDEITLDFFKKFKKPEVVEKKSPPVAMETAEIRHHLATDSSSTKGIL